MNGPTRMRRPLYRPDVTWLMPGAQAVPPLDSDALAVIRDRAATVTLQCAEWLRTAPQVTSPQLVVDHEITGAYAAGIAEVLSWLLADGDGLPAPMLADYITGAVLDETKG